ncbi:MAG TPA: hypothetical protein VJY35_12500 [Candidatus Eisenbacteria bacterium]|nr:hypothetical protein [Candidatus Eisenbacteria bacterium]
MLTLWAAVVAERLGYDRDEAVTLGRLVAGLNAADKAGGLGLRKPRTRDPKKPRQPIEVPLLGRIVPAVDTPDGIRATTDGKPTDPATVHRYLESRFGGALDEVRAAMAALAKSRTREKLASEAYALYEAFRPGIPRGVRGWGAKGTLDPAKIRSLATQKPSRD